MSAEGAIALVLLIGIGLFAYFSNQISALESRLARLEFELDLLQDSADADVRPMPPVLSSLAPAAVQPAVALAPAAVQPAASPPTSQLGPAQAPVPRTPSRSRAEWEALIGGKLLNRIGALALVIGFGFFLKYAFDNNWLTESMRVLLGLVIGGGLLGAAHRLERRGFQIVAQGLVGAGISILYLSVYASFNFYQLVSQQSAFLLMSLVTVVAFAQALRYNSLAVGLLSWSGGFLTPFLLSSGQANALGLFSYLVLLVAGLIGILVLRPDWLVLEPLTLLATYGTYLLWYGEHYQPADLLVAAVFLSLIWGLFHLLHVARPLTAGTPQLVRQGLAGLNILFYYLALYELLSPRYEGWAPAVTLLLGAIYLLTQLGQLRSDPAARLAHLQSAWTGVLLIALATALELEGFRLILAWSLEALALAWLGSRRLSYFWPPALGLFSLSTLGIILLQHTDGWYLQVLLNERALTFITLAVTLGLGALLARELGHPQAGRLAAALHVGWCLVLLVLWSSEVDTYFEDLTHGVLWAQASALYYRAGLVKVLGWAVYAMALLWLGGRTRLAPIFFSGLGVLGLAGLAGAEQALEYEPLSRFIPLANLRALTLAVLVVGVALAASWLRSLKPPQLSARQLAQLLLVLQAALVLLLFELLSVEIRDSFGRQMVSTPLGPRSGQLERLRNLLQLSLSVAWLGYSILLLGVGLWRRLPALRIMAILLFGISIFKIFVYDLAFLETLYRIGSFMGLGVILLTVSYLYQRYKEIIFDSLLQGEEPAPSS